MSYAALLQAAPNSVKAMPLFSVSNRKLAEIMSESHAAAAKGLGEELAPDFLAIARGQPYDKPKLPAHSPARGVISGFLAKIGL